MKKLLGLALLLGALTACSGGGSAPDSGGGSSNGGGGGPTDPDAGLTSCQRYVKHLDWGNFASHSSCWFQNYSGIPNAAVSYAAIRAPMVDFNFDTGSYDSDLCYHSTYATHVYIKGDIEMDAPWKVPAVNGGDSNGVYFRSERYNSDSSRLGAYYYYNNTYINDAHVPCDLINYDVRVRRLYRVNGVIVEGEDLGYVDSTPDVWGNCRIIRYNDEPDIAAYTIRVTTKLAYGSRSGYGSMYDSETYKDYYCPYYYKAGTSEVLSEKAKAIISDARKAEGITDEETIPQRLRHTSNERHDVKVIATKESFQSAIDGRAEAKGLTATAEVKGKSGATLTKETVSNLENRDVMVRENKKLVDAGEVIENTSAEQKAIKKNQQEDARKQKKDDKQ